MRENLTPQEAYSAEKKARQILREWPSGDIDALALSAALNAGIALAVRLHRESRSDVA